MPKQHRPTVMVCPACGGAWTRGTPDYCDRCAGLGRVPYPPRPPPRVTPRNHTIVVYVTAEEKAEIKTSAAEKGMAVGEYLRVKGLNRNEPTAKPKGARCEEKKDDGKADQAERSCEGKA